MHMVVDVLHAVAVIAVALGAVAELHGGVVGVGDAAHGAFMQIAPVLPHLSLGFFFFYLLPVSHACVFTARAVDKMRKTGQNSNRSDHPAGFAGRISGKETGIRESCAGMPEWRKK